LSHDDPRLRLADTFWIVFEYQKRYKRNETVTQHRTGDPLICPVGMWATIVKRVGSYPGSTDDTAVNTFHLESNNTQIQGSKALSRIWEAVRVIGKSKLSFGPEGIGLPSILSGTAMIMYFGVVPVFMIC
jgi:hypothetical protein